MYSQSSHEDHTASDSSPLDTMLSSVSLDGQREHFQQHHIPPQQVQCPSLELASTNSNRFKQVRFSYVTIRNYDITMGDNPAVTAGPPIQLDWEYEEIPSLPVRDFEQFKLKRRGACTLSFYVPISENRVLTISPDFRTGILRRAGFSDWEISQTMRNVKKIQQQRTRTALAFPFYRVEYAMRSAGRKLQRTMGSGAQNHSSTIPKHQGRRQEDEMTTGTLLEDQYFYGDDAYSPPSSP
jgi:hypothetical protein